MKRLEKVSPTDKALVLSVFAQGEFSALLTATALTIINFVFAKFAKLFV